MVHISQNHALSRHTRIVFARLIHPQGYAIDEYDKHAYTLEPRRRDQLKAKVARLTALRKVFERHRHIASE